MFKPLLLASSIAIALTGCQATQESKVTQEVDVTTVTSTISLEESAKFNALLEVFFNEGIEIYPMYGTYMGDKKYNDKFAYPLPQSEVLQSELNEKYRKALSKIDREKLDPQGKISFDIIQRDLALQLTGQQFPDKYLPINQMDGLHNDLAAFGSGQSAQPFETVEDYDAFLKRAAGFKPWLDSVMDAMKEGMKQGVTLPQVLAKKLVPQFSAHVVYNPEDSLFWGPIKAMPEGFSDADKKRLTSAYREVIMTDVIPAYRNMAEFLEEIYIPNSRSTVGYSDLPNGKAWYQHEIESHTSLTLPAEEIHNIGLREVDRILGEMNKVREQVKFAGDLAAFFVHLRESEQFYFESPEALIAAYEKVKAKIDAKVPLLFDVAPKADYVVKPVEAFRAQSAPGASYQGPSADGTKPGIFYINTYNLKAQPNFIVETLSIHEAAPGHHFQIALQQEIEGLPTFRKFGGDTAFVEGWALYAESLGKELGLFTDPYQWYGRLVDEQLRAMRLVVDTGLHAKGWTRAQAIEFMLKNSSMAESDVTAEVERYIAWPGQALSYKLGQFKIRELREYAAKELGDKFDIKAFHTQILIDGAMPMSILEEKIKRWVESQKG
ncbi:protein of unknown function DUF885 [Pseudoalteromonas luteoviolacea B = ATCC 29581]|nr:protein of unknown function DUF885 [Pseudoalteromonas luteoviolacea B = ATCC 29581]